MIIIFGFSYYISRCFFSRKAVDKKKKKIILSTAGIGIFLIFVLLLVFDNIYYRSGDIAKKALEGNDKVRVEKAGNVYFFDGQKEDKAIIFYPGGKVDYLAYAPLMMKLAEGGYDCFLIEMPFQLAIFNKNAAASVIKKYDYDHWFIAGHSLGGIAASAFAAENSDIFDGIIMLASYSTIEIPDDLVYCSIYGSNDGCLDKDVYDNLRLLWPREHLEVVINGGNHSQFGDYGLQKGDNEASVSADEQLTMTLMAIVSCFEYD